MRQAQSSGKRLRAALTAITARATIRRRPCCISTLQATTCRPRESGDPAVDTTKRRHKPRSRRERRKAASLIASWYPGCSRTRIANASTTQCSRARPVFDCRLPPGLRRRKTSGRCAEPRWRSFSTGAIQPNVMTLSTGKSTRAGDPRPRRLRIEAAAPRIGLGSAFAIRAEAVRQREAYLGDERVFGSRPIRCSCIAARVAAKCRC